MVESIDYLDFCIEPVVEKDTIPLQCWQTISLSNIWIPSHLLVNRSKGCNTKGGQGLFHTLQKKDVSKYSESFSVYIDSNIENDQDDIFLSDSNEDISSSIPVKLEESKSEPDNLSFDSDDFASHVPKEFNISKKKYSGNVPSNAPCRRNDDICSNLEISNVDNLYSYDKQKNPKMVCLEKHPEKSYLVADKDDDLSIPKIEEDKDHNLSIPKLEKIDFNESHRSSAFKSEISEQYQDLKNVQTLERVNKDSDSHVSLKEIINDTPVASLKDFSCNFEYRKKDSDISSFCDKQKSNSKKARKEKKGKKLEKVVPIGSLFEDMDATQEFNANRYMNHILQERERLACIGDNPLVSKVEYPDLTPEEPAFVHCNKAVEEENVDFTPTFSSLIHSAKKCLLVPDCENDLNTPAEIVETAPDLVCGKIVIENIPLDVTEEDISLILCGYGEIKNFSMTSNGKCLKVFVEIELICDIDWVIECLNGTEPFGTSTGVLKCYQQTD